MTTESQRHPADAEVLMVWGDNNKDRRALFKIFSATGAQVRYADQQPKSEVNDACRLVVIDYDAVRDVAVEVLGNLSRMPTPPPVLVLTSSRDKRDLIELFSHNALTNFCAKNTDILANELIVTVQKIMRKRLFGLDKYLTWGAHVFEARISSSTSRHSAIEELEGYLHAIGANKRLTGLARDVADELLTNAIYNAPTDRSGKPKYARLSRTEKVELEPNEQVMFSFACDGRQLGVSVSDQFGRLETDVVLNYLRKCFAGGSDQMDVKEGGAGLGLFYTFQSLNTLVVNLAPGQRTEMIGLMDISGNYKDFALQPKSLHLFIDRSGR